MECFRSYTDKYSTSELVEIINKAMYDDGNEENGQTVYNEDTTVIFIPSVWDGFIVSVYDQSGDRLADARVE